MNFNVDIYLTAHNTFMEDLTLHTLNFKGLENLLVCYSN
jgi:hypothetical protein